MCLMWALCSRLELEILSCQWSLVGFRGGVLFQQSMGLGSPGPLMVTVTLGLLWPSVIWHTCPSLVESGWGSLSTRHSSWAGVGVVRGEKITHMPAFLCVPHRQNTAKVQDPPQDILSMESPKVGGLKLVFASGQPLGVLPVSLAPSPIISLPVPLLPIPLPPLPPSHP